MDPGFRKSKKTEDRCRGASSWLCFRPLDHTRRRERGGKEESRRKTWFSRTRRTVPVDEVLEAETSWDGEGSSEPAVTRRRRWWRFFDVYSKERSRIAATNRASEEEQTEQSAEPTVPPNPPTAPSAASPTIDDSLQVPRLRIPCSLMSELENEHESEAADGEQGTASTVYSTPTFTGFKIPTTCLLRDGDRIVTRCSLSPVAVAVDLRVPVAGLSVVIVMLVGLLGGSRSLAIACTTAWFYLLPTLRPWMI